MACSQHKNKNEVARIMKYRYVVHPTSFLFFPPPPHVNEEKGGKNTANIRQKYISYQKIITIRTLSIRAVFFFLVPFLFLFFDLFLKGKTSPYAFHTRSSYSSLLHTLNPSFSLPSLYFSHVVFFLLLLFLRILTLFHGIPCNFFSLTKYKKPPFCLSLSLHLYANRTFSPVLIPFPY